jgi:hypothetical protein
MSSTIPEDAKDVACWIDYRTQSSRGLLVRNGPVERKRSSTMSELYTLQKPQRRESSSLFGSYQTWTKTALKVDFASVGEETTRARAGSL